MSSGCINIMPCISNNVIWIVLPVTWILIATRDSALHFPVQKWTVRHLKVLPPKKPKNDQIHHFPTSFSSFACFSWSNPEVEKATSFQQMGVCTQCTALEGLSAFDLNFNLFFYFKLSFITVFHHFKLITLLLTWLIHLIFRWKISNFE